MHFSQILLAKKLPPYSLLLISIETLFPSFKQLYIKHWLFTRHRWDFRDSTVGHAWCGWTEIKFGMAGIEWEFGGKCLEKSSKRQSRAKSYSMGRHYKNFSCESVGKTLGILNREVTWSELFPFKMIKLNIMRNILVCWLKEGLYQNDLRELLRSGWVLVLFCWKTHTLTTFNRDYEKSEMTKFNGLSN